MSSMNTFRFADHDVYQLLYELRLFPTELIELIIRLTGGCDPFEHRSTLLSRYTGSSYSGIIASNNEHLWLIRTYQTEQFMIFDQYFQEAITIIDTSHLDTNILSTAILDVNRIWTGKITGTKLTLLENKGKGVDVDFKTSFDDNVKYTESFWYAGIVRLFSHRTKLCLMASDNYTEASKCRMYDVKNPLQPNFLYEKEFNTGSVNIVFMKDSVFMYDRIGFIESNIENGVIIRRCDHPNFTTYGIRSFSVTISITGYHFLIEHVRPIQPDVPVYSGMVDDPSEVAIYAAFISEESDIHNPSSVILYEENPFVDYRKGKYFRNVACSEDAIAFIHESTGSSYIDVISVGAFTDHVLIKNMNQKKLDESYVKKK
jgi:hypothetical protein